MSGSGKGADRHREIVRKLDELIDGWVPSQPIYSKELADLIGVSIRTLQDATPRTMGMSLHGYVRWKRLMLARQKLEHGATSVTSAALESGFWHLGEFAKRYQMLFGELPSATLRSALLRSGKKRRICSRRRAVRVTACGRCEGCGWVCENHPDKQWEGKQACGCGAPGAPCPNCNATNDRDAPRMPGGFKTDVDKDGSRH
jgi:AraC-like DNA-binding protein